MEAEEVELKQLRTQLSLSERTHEQWVDLFNHFDQDRDGKISYRELKHELKTNHCIPSEVAKKILRRGDLNEDGYLDLNEFLTLLREHRAIRGIFSQSVNKWVNTVCYIPKRRVQATAFGDTIDARGQYEEEYSCWPPPLCMLIVSMLEILVFAYDAIIRNPGESEIHTMLASYFVYNPRRRIEAWRFLTYMFVHIGVFHLLINLFVQIILGIPLEMVHRWWRVLIIYISGVIAGSLGTSVSDPEVYLAGASGGVYAIMAAQVATLIINWKEIEFAAIQLCIFLFLALTDIGIAVHSRYVLEEDNRTSYAAHIAGATAGLLIGINVLRNLEVRSWEKKLWWVSIIMYTVLMVAAIIWHVAYPEYFPKQVA